MTVQGPPLTIQKAFQSCSVGVTVSDVAPPADGETEKLKPSKEKKTWTRTISETPQAGKEERCYSHDSFLRIQ